MKLFLAFAAIASVATIAAAKSCTSDVALAWPYTTDDDESTDCGDDEATCAAIAAEANCNALSLIDDSDSTCLGGWKRSKRAVNLDCATSEECFVYLDGSLLCLDQTTGDYHDDVGGNGNVVSGVYTAPGGNVQTVTGVSAEPSTTATAARASQTTTLITTTASASQTTPLITATASSSTSSASSQSSSVAQSSTAAQSSTSSQSPTASSSSPVAQQTGAAAPHVSRRSGVFLALAMPLVLAMQ